MAEARSYGMYRQKRLREGISQARGRDFLNMADRPASRRRSSPANRGLQRRLSSHDGFMDRIRRRRSFDDCGGFSVTRSALPDQHLQWNCDESHRSALAFAPIACQYSRSIRISEGLTAFAARMVVVRWSASLG